MSRDKLPEMVGRELSVARERLEAAGVAVEIVETSPPREDPHRHPLSETWRVLQQRETGGAITLVVAREIAAGQGEADAVPE